MNIRELLKEPAYREYFCKEVKYPARVYHPKPWNVWAKKQNGKWAGKSFATYKEAFALLQQILKSPVYVDASISSRLLGFQPPPELRALFPMHEWCLMCRRPVHRTPMKRHHALNQEFHRYFTEFPVCQYCGSRSDTDLTVVPYNPKKKKK